jgi:hypothetical protein
MHPKKDEISATILGILLAMLAVFSVVFVARFIFGGPEDSWICSHGQWVMHGRSAISKPVTACP